MKKKVNWFSGQQVLVEDMGQLNAGYEEQGRRIITDLWVPGIISDPNGLSNLQVTVDSLTQTLINVNWGTAYSHDGHRIAISQDQTYYPGNPTFTTNGVCTPQSTGNKAIPLASYVAGQSNFVWIQYLETSETNPKEISSFDGSVHYPFADNGYQIVVNTTNYPGNTVGLTNAVYLATVFGQGPSAPLVPGPNGITNFSPQYMSVIIADKSITPSKISQSNGSFTFPGLCTTTLLASSNAYVPLFPLAPQSAVSKQFVEHAELGLALSKATLNFNYDGNFNLINVVVSGSSSGTITPSYDGFSNYVFVAENVDGVVGSHTIVWNTINGVSVISSVVESAP